jgi:hypothetical protein
MSHMRDAIARRRKVSFRTSKGFFSGDPHAMLVDRKCRGPTVLMWIIGEDGAEGWKRICLANIYDLDLHPESFLTRMKPSRI